MEVEREILEPKLHKTVQSQLHNIQNQYTFFGYCQNRYITTPLKPGRDVWKETLLSSFSIVRFSGALSTVPSSAIISTAESQNYATHTKTV